MKPILCLFLLCLLACSQAAAQNARYVNIFIGTDGTGHCFPGPSRPFCIVQPGSTIPFSTIRSGGTLTFQMREP